MTITPVQATYFGLPGTLLFALLLLFALGGWSLRNRAVLATVAFGVLVNVTLLALKGLARQKWPEKDPQRQNPPRLQRLGVSRVFCGK